MRVCLVSLDFKPYRSSGLTIYAEDLARGLAELGSTVTVLAARRPGLPAFERQEGVELYRVPIDRLDWITYGWRAVQLLRRLERQTSFDVVHFLDVHFGYAYRAPYVASLWQSFRQRLTAHHGRPYHTDAIDCLRRQVYYRVARRFMEKPSLARAGRLLASCRSTRDEFIQHYGVSPQRIDLGIQGIDTDVFKRCETGELRARLGLDGCRLLLFVGFATPRKGLEYLAQAMLLLPPDVHLIIIGRWDPRYRRRVLAQLGSATDRVHELGFVPDEQRPAYYSMADAYVSPSLLEGLGITPIEALACGTPAVVTSASSGPEEVGDAGLVIPPCDPEALASAVNHLLEHDDVRHRLGERGRKRVLEEFTLTRMAEITMRTYSIFLAERAGMPGDEGSTD